MTDKEIVERTNELATELYAMMGCRNKPGFKYYEAHHPQEKLMWEMAVKAQETLCGTDAQEALEQFLAEEQDE